MAERYLWGQLAWSLVLVLELEVEKPGPLDSPLMVPVRRTDREAR
jgi:hypothetical protein